MTRPPRPRFIFPSHALAGGVAAGTSYLGLTSDLYAQASGPIILGSHCELTGCFASWGYWNDKAAKAAVHLSLSCLGRRCRGRDVLPWLDERPLRASQWTDHPRQPLRTDRLFCVVGLLE